MRALLCLLCVLMLSPLCALADKRTVHIATGGASGVYYPVGGAICRLLNKSRRQHGMRCIVKNSAGSVDNINHLRHARTTFAIVQSDVQASAWRGDEVFSDPAPFKALRAVFSLYSEPLHLLVSRKSDIQSTADLPGHRINLGAIGSGSRALAQLLLQALNWQAQDFVALEAITPMRQARALCRGRVDVSLWVAGIPNNAAKEAIGACQARLLPITGPAVTTLLQFHPAYTATHIPAETYPNQAHTIETFGPLATLLTTRDTSEEVVYQLVKTLMDNLRSLKRSHPALESLAPEAMFKVGLSAPLHAGAERYLRLDLSPESKP